MSYRVFDASGAQVAVTDDWRRANTYLACGFTVAAQPDVALSDTRAFQLVALRDRLNDAINAFYGNGAECFITNRARIGRLIALRRRIHARLALANRWLATGGAK